MILTNCAACAAPLAIDHKKRCSRCKSRYCNEACHGSRRDVEAYWATLRDASAHGHAAGNAAARDVHGKAGFVLALCDAFRRVDESRS